MMQSCIRGWFGKSALRLCVWQSYSDKRVRVKWVRSISSSRLHLGQKSGKLCSTVSSRILTRVLLWQIGHKSHWLLLFTVVPPVHQRDSFAATNGAGGSVYLKGWQYGHLNHS